MIDGNLKALSERVVAALKSSSPARVMEIPLEKPTTAQLDLSVENDLVANTNCTDNAEVTGLIDTLLAQAGATYGIGGYNEKRGWYARGEQFSQADEVRSIHLGIDIWTPAGMPVFSPFDAVVHSAQDNALFGDYGPTIILTHTLSGETFYSLYGHLSRESLGGMNPGTVIKRGQRIGAIGAPPINGDWPPHLHFQLIVDMLGKIGDYPGVAGESERERYLTLCPNPNLVLRVGQE